MSKIFAVNTGSSSLKFKIYEMPEERVICSGLAERIGYQNAHFTLKDATGVKLDSFEVAILDHTVAVQITIERLLEHKIIKDVSEIKGFGHRIVQGGKFFDQSVIVDDEVLRIVDGLKTLAPLHNASHLLGYYAFKKYVPNVPSVFVFDTAFHQSMEPQDYTFAIPLEYTQKYDIRRYGAHGTSHKYLAEKTMTYLKGKKDRRVITCHIGSGASICAIRNEKCVATSMGLTPLGGIMMGTRTGDMDPSVFYYLCKVLNKPYDEVYDILNKKSGLLGVSEVSNDSRDVLEAVEKGVPNAILADEMFIRRIVDYIGQYYLRLGGCDAIVFSAGVGENDGRTREKICDQLEVLGVKINRELNLPLRGVEKDVTLEGSSMKVLVIPTDEEVMIARDVYRLGNIK